nr:importin subunit beta-1-like [Aegilops tauschii subsp. strangulata]
MDISMSEEQEGDENVEQEGVNLEDIWGQEGDEAVEGIYMTCLGLAARTMKDAVVPLVMQFVECSISGPHCHSRKVAIFPLAFILEGPSVKQLAPVVHLLLDMMKDPEEGVRGRAAWTLALVFELVGANKIIRNEGGLPGIMAILIERSKDVPQVSIEVYRALYFLVRGYGENAKSKSCELSPFVKPLIDALLCASELAKENPFRLPACTSAYEALSEIVRVCNIEELEVCRAVGGLMSQIFRRLNIMINRQGEAVSSVERKNRGLLEVLLCVTVIVHVMEQPLPVVLLLMPLVIALAIGEKFEKYLPLVMEKLREAAELNPEDNKDHGNKVREGIFKAYHGILGGINDQKSGLKVAMALVDFTEGVCKDHSKIKTRDGRNTSVAMAGIDALSQLPSRAEA